MALSRKERVSRAIYRQAIDYFPSHIDFTASAALQITTALGHSLEELDELLDNHLAQCYSLGDVEWYLQDPPILETGVGLGLAHFRENPEIVYDDWGVGWNLVPEGGWPEVHPLENLEAYADYQFPNPAHPHHMDLVRKIVETNRSGQKFVLASQHSVLFERAWTLRGYQNALMDFYLHRDFVEELYDRITEYHVGLARQFVAAGIDGIRIGDDYGTQKGLVMKPGFWREVLKPRLKRIYEIYQQAGIPIIHHTCGDVRQILDDFIELKLDVLNPVQPMAMPIEWLQEKYGHALSFYGGIDTQQLLPFSDPEKIREAVRHAIEVLGRRGGYIISPAQDIMVDVPLSNVQALIAAIKEYRTMVKV